MEEIRFNFGVRSYSVFVGVDLIGKSGQILQEQGVKGRVMVVTNPTIARWYLQPLLYSLEEAGYEVRTIKVPDGEGYKSLKQANRIYDALVEYQYDRKSILIALGGGVIGDLTGFVAATYMRGIDFVQIPTTLLSQVDSSIGGKVAVNHPKGKNLIGCFYQPRVVIADVTSFKTLPQREFSSGMAEVIKHGVILDENYLQLIHGELATISQIEPGFMTWVVAGSCVIKAKVVEEDEKETGVRAVLNFGHTLGHALESVTNYTTFKHGEAIAIGMIAAIKLSKRRGLLEQPELEDMVREIFQSLQLPVTIPNLAVSELVPALYLDKKVEFGNIRWVLPRRIGAVEIVGDLQQAWVEDVLREMGAIG